MNALPGGLSARETRAVLLAALREVHGAGARLETWSAHPLLKRGKRRTVRYDLHASVRGVPYVQHYQWVGKFYDRDDTARRAHTILRQLGATDWATRSALVIPSVVAYYAPRHLLLLTYQPGESVTSAIVHYDALVLRTLGRALTAFHATPAIVDGLTSPAAVLDDVRQRIADLRARFPDQTASLQHMLLELVHETPSELATPAFLHGDLGPAHLRWHMGRIVVLDIDKCTRGDPALDLGNLLTQVRRITLRRPGKLPDFASLHRAILDAYQAWSPQDPDLARRVAWYEQLMLVRKAHFLVSNTTRYRSAEAMRERHAEAVRLLGELPGFMESGAPRKASSSHGDAPEGPRGPAHG